MKYIIVDELHTYKGVFGSHVAHVLRRLKRICNYYGSNPVFICTSATIANPAELGGVAYKYRDATHFEQRGTSWEKTFYLLQSSRNPSDIRYSTKCGLEVRDIASLLYREGIQTIVFAKSRVRVEMLVTYMKELTKKKLFDETVMGYQRWLFTFGTQKN